MNMNATAMDLHQLQPPIGIPKSIDQFSKLDFADPRTGKSRGFCFIIFKEVTSRENALGAGDHVVNGKKVTVKKAKPREKQVNFTEEN